MKSVNYFGYEIFEDGCILSKKNKKKLKFHSDKRGYLRMKLCNIGIEKEITVHRLIGIMFIPNPENKPQINHKNGIKTDNRIENLEWVTNQENMDHAHRIGLYNLKGINNKRSIQVLQYDKKGNYIAEYGGIREAGRVTNINSNHIRETIHNIRRSAGGFIWRKAS